MWRLGGVCILILAVAGCGGNSGGAPPAPDVLNVAVADEPRAALIGREILQRGGNAVDAVTAMGLAMAATLPSRVGPGGGGVCLVHDPAAGVVRAIDFLPRGGGTAPAPGFLRGLFALHGAYGTVRWAELMATAENLARFGQPMSRALARDVAATPPERLPAALGGGAEGPPRGEGDTVRFPALAATLGRVRADGVGAFHDGLLAREVSEGAAAAGLSLPVGELRGYRPAWVDTVAFDVGSDRLHFAPASGVAGPAQERLWRALALEQSHGGPGPAGGMDVIAEVPGGAVVPGGASAVAVSADNMAAACAFSLGGLFGSGRVAGGTGVLLAAAPPTGQPVHGGLALVVNEPLTTALLAAAGADSVAALTVPLLERLAAGRSPGEAVAAPRTPSDRPGPEAPAAAGRGVLIGCDWDRGREKTCRGAADPRGFGLAAGAAVGG